MPVPKFAPAHRGYNKQQVDQYVRQKQEEYAHTLDAMRERIAGLEEQLKAIERESDQIKAKENKIAQALLDATDYKQAKLDEIERLGNAEMDRLKLFRAKWTTYVQEALGADPTLVATLNKTLDEYQTTLRATLQKELGLAKDPLDTEYYSEQTRTKGGRDIPIHIDELLKKLQE